MLMARACGYNPASPASGHSFIRAFASEFVIAQQSVRRGNAGPWGVHPIARENESYDPFSETGARRLRIWHSGEDACVGRTK